MAAPLDHVAAIAPPVADEGWLHRRGPGWLVVMGKEMAEGLTSLRFTIVLALLALAAAAPVYAASGAIRDAAEGASGVAALFLALFTIGADPVPSFVALVGFVAPLLGIAFGFDAINGERAQGTLPRLLSQPIHRDDAEEQDGGQRLLGGGVCREDHRTAPFSYCSLRDRASGSSFAVE